VKLNAVIQNHTEFKSKKESGFVAIGIISGFGVNTNNASICFTRDTLMLTQDGQKPICDIKVGDMVATMDRGMQPVRWIG
jgi:hypothetical protein